MFGTRCVSMILGAINSALSTTFDEDRMPSCRPLRKARPVPWQLARVIHDECIWRCLNCRHAHQFKASRARIDRETLEALCDRHRLRTAVPLQSGRSPQIPAAAWMLGVNPSTCVQVALVKIPRAGRGWGARRRTPTAIGVGGINPSAPVQVAAVIVLAARLGVGRACVPGHRDHSCRQRGQEPQDSKAHDVSPYPHRCQLPPKSRYL